MAPSHPPSSSGREAAAPFSIADAAALVARIALHSPTSVGLAEQPTAEAVHTWMASRKRGMTAIASVATEMIDSTAGFTPDPIWLAWVQSAYPEVFEQLVAAASPSSSRRPVAETTRESDPRPNRPARRSGTRRASHKK